MIPLGIKEIMEGIQLTMEPVKKSGFMELDRIFNEHKRLKTKIVKNPWFEGGENAQKTHKRKA